MYARYDIERSLYVVEWNGVHADAIDDRVLYVIAHALRSVYDNVTMMYSKDRSIVTLMAYDKVGKVAAHLDMRTERNVSCPIGESQPAC